MKIDLLITFNVTKPKVDIKHIMLWFLRALRVLRGEMMKSDARSCGTTMANRSGGSRGR